MRLWHYKLIPYLPRLQLLSQWRECCCIAKSMVEKGTPNHILVNKILDYPLGMFTTYTKIVRDEITSRGYNISSAALKKYRSNIDKCSKKLNISESGSIDELYEGWHNDIYLRQCLYNLEEKAMCEGVSAEEWQRIYDKFKDFTPLWEGK